MTIELRSLHHDDVIKWKHFPRNWPFVRGIYRGPHKDQWRGAFMFSLSCALNKRLSKQSSGWRFETPSRSLWRHCNASTLTHSVYSLWRHNRLRKSLWLGNCEVSTLKVISKSLDIDFIHSNIHYRSCGTYVICSYIYMYLVFDNTMYFSVCSKWNHLH